MNRWQLWTAVASGALAIGGPTSYYGYRAVFRGDAAPEMAQAEGDSTAGGDATAQPPTPIPVSGDDTAGPDNPIQVASFNTPPNVVSDGPASDSSASNERIIRGNNDFGPPPDRPSGDFPAPSGGEYRPGKPMSLSDSNFAAPTASAYSAQLSDESGDQPGGGTVGATISDEPPAQGTYGPPNSIAPSSTPPSSGPLTAGPGNLNISDNSPPEQPPAEFPPASVGDKPSATPPRELDQPEAMGEIPTPSNSMNNGGPANGGYIPATPPSGLYGGAPAGLRELPPGSGAPVAQERSVDPGTTPPATFSPQSFPRESATLGAPTSGFPSTPRATQITNVPGNLSSDIPGERNIEGAQSPTLILQKSAPEEIQVGKATKFAIIVRNNGATTAHGVVVTDRIPQGTQFIESTPPATPTTAGILAWDLGTLEAGQESTISIDLMPEAEGEIGSVAQVTFHAQAGVRTKATRPLLTVEHSGPDRVLIGDMVEFEITVSNPGTGVTTGVVVEVDVPEQLAHEGGREIMSDRFELRPNETRKLSLAMQAVKAGTIDNLVRAHADANLAVEHRRRLEVVAPELEIAITGPTRRFLERQVTYQVLVANPGTAPAKDVELVAHLPQGLKFVATENKGRYDQTRHAVVWSLEELPAGESGSVQLSALPIDVGEQKLHVEGRANLGLQAQFDHTTVVEGKSELVFSVADENDPIEVGAETAYVIKVTNKGTKPATRVQVAAQLPPELTPIKADGPSRAEVQGKLVLMEPIPQLGPNEEVTYRLVVQGQKSGDHVVRIQLSSDESTTPVTKEESTKVYADE